MNNSKNLLIAFLFFAFFSFIIFNELPFNNSMRSKTPAKHFKKYEKKEQKLREAKDDNPEQYIKYEKEIRTLPGKAEPDYTSNYRIKEYLKAFGVSDINSIKFRKTNSTISWEERGPANVQGRTRAVVADPRDNTGSTWLIGSVGGGVWKTTDSGKHWQNLTEGLPNLSTSSLAICKNTPDIIYVGTGEGFYNIDAIGGSGIWKSTDGGNSWTQLSSTTNAAQFRDVTRIVVNPADANELVVTTNHNTNRLSKILRSSDGGASWQETLVDSSSNDFQQIVADPGNFNNLYATSYGKGVYKSTDAGKSWNYSSSGIDLINLGRLEMAVSPVNSNNLFLVADQNGKAVFYFSNNSGVSWKKFKPDKNWLGSQGWYDNVVTADLFDEYSCYVGGIDIMKVTVSGSSLIVKVITDVYGNYNQKSKGVHPDQHAITLIALNKSQKTFRMILGNDGGVFYSDDAGSTFTKTGNGLNTSQFYSADKTNGSNQYIGGTQDNGTHISPSGFNPNATTSWTQVVGGDGFASAWNYSDPSEVLASLYNDLIVKSTDGGRNFKNNSPPLLQDDSAPFITHIAKSNQDPYLIFTYSGAGIWRSDNFADTWNFIPVKSGSYKGASSFTQVEISLANPQIVWAASIVGPSDSALVSTDGGFTFNKTQPIGFIPKMRLSGLTTDPTNPNTAYLLFSAANKPKIIRTTDLGKTWKELSGFGLNGNSSNGFPDVAVYSLLVMPFNTNIIWAGTEIGIFESTDDGGNWHPLQSGLPATSIWQMRIVNNQVVVATHGRGVWTATLNELSGYEPPSVTLPPQLKGLSINKNTVALNLILRSNYDSTHILFDNRVMSVIFNTRPTDTTVTLHYSPSNTVTRKIQAISFKGSKEYKSGFVFQTFYNYSHPVAAYATDFSDNGADFELNGFDITKEKGFSDKALNSPHPYNDAKEITATLLKPIIVASNNAFLSYKDVALVEPGEANTKFGDPYFYDYVVVEATGNGGNWIPLSDGYDARFDQNWLSYFNNNAAPDSSLFRNHTVDLLKSFNPGDTILVRFRLFADTYTHGFGWVVDNLEIQKKLTDVEDKSILPGKYALLQNYPNPFNPTTTIEFSIPEIQKNIKEENPGVNEVLLKVYDVLGKEVKTLVNKKLKPGNYKVRFNANNLPSGVYFYRLKAGNFSGVKKMILLK